MRIEFCGVFHYADDGIDIDFPDVPCAVTCAYSREEAFKMAEEVLEIVLHGTQYKNLPIATPRDLIKCDDTSEVVDIAISMNVDRGVLYGPSVVEIQSRTD